MTDTDSDLVPQDIMVYPNPTIGDINIHSDSHFPIQRIDLIDSRGRSVWSRQFPSVHKQSINLNVPPGIYFLRLHSSTEVTIRKINVIR